MQSVMNFFARRFLAFYFIAMALLLSGFVRSAFASEIDNVVAVSEAFNHSKNGARIQMILLALAPPNCKAGGKLAMHTERHSEPGKDVVMVFCWRPVGAGQRLTAIRIYSPGAEPTSEADGFTLPIEKFSKPKSLISPWG
jgi:hypothetical protein